VLKLSTFTFVTPHRAQFEFPAIFARAGRGAAQVNDGWMKEENVPMRLDCSVKSGMPAMELTDEAMESIARGAAGHFCFPRMDGTTKGHCQFLSLSRKAVPYSCRPTQTTLPPIGEGFVLLSLQCRNWLKDAMPAKDMKPGS
jgi:hypothetical protein